MKIIKRIILNIYVKILQYRIMQCVKHGSWAKYLKLKRILQTIEEKLICP